jgi:hypothetical protein
MLMAHPTVLRNLLDHYEGLQAMAKEEMAVLLHGAGGSAEQALAWLGPQVRGDGLLLLAPQAVASTWDVIVHTGPGCMPTNGCARTKPIGGSCRRRALGTGRGSRRRAARHRARGVPEPDSIATCALSPGGTSTP